MDAGTLYLCTCAGTFGNDWWGAGTSTCALCRYFWKFLFGRRYTCEECLEGMEWIEAYFEDPIFQVQSKPKPLYKTTFATKKTFYKTTFQEEKPWALRFFRWRRCSGLNSTGVMMRNRCVFRPFRCTTAIVLINLYFRLCILAL